MSCFLCQGPGPILEFNPCEQCIGIMRTGKIICARSTNPTDNGIDDTPEMMGQRIILDGIPELVETFPRMPFAIMLMTIGHRWSYIPDWAWTEMEERQTAKPSPLTLLSNQDN